MEAPCRFRDFKHSQLIANSVPLLSICFFQVVVQDVQAADWGGGRFDYLVQVALNNYLVSSLVNTGISLLYMGSFSIRVHFTWKCHFLMCSHAVLASSF